MSNKLFGMSLLTFFSRPSRFFTSLESQPHLKKGLTVFGMAAVSQILVSIYILGYKTVYEVALGEYSMTEIKLFSPDYLVMSSLTTVFVALVMLVGVGRIMGRFFGKSTSSMKTFINAVLHLFMILAFVNAVYVALAVGAPSEKYYVFGVEFTDVVFHGAKLSWTGSDGEKVAVEAEILYARKANVTRVYQNQTPVESSAYTAEEIKTILRTTQLHATLSQPSAPPHTLPEKITVESFSFTNLNVKNVVLTSVAAVRGEPGAFLVQLSLFRNVAWKALTSVYLGFCVSALHATSKKTSFLIMLVSYLVLTNLVPTLF
ncbi:MAG: hypothetical protein QXQ70_02685 [Candidatus Caldarchaeum sp.]